MNRCRVSEEEIAYNSVAKDKKEDFKRYIEVANDLIGDIKPGEGIAWDAIGNDDETTMSLCEVLKNYDENPTLQAAHHNHVLVCNLIDAVRAYCAGHVIASE